MKTIISAAELVTRVLGVQKKREDTNYRLLKFCLQCPISGGILLYNPMTLELLVLSDEEAGRITQIDELIAKWFLVPAEQNDIQLANQLREIVFSLQKQKENITCYTIFTTTNCNARCFYCFENGCKRMNMSPNTAEHLVKFIVEHCGGDEVDLHWFGGEPLVNYKAIDIICKGLANAGVKYKSAMISNAYLFDEKLAQKAASLWKLEKIQITLDGTEEVYNNVKAYINPDGSPFRRVLKNIGLLLDSGIRVTVRMNINEENLRDLLCLTDLLAKQFGDRKGFFVYSTPLYDRKASESGDIQWTRTRNESLIRDYREIKDKLCQLGWFREKRLPHNIKTAHCMADNDAATTVLPDGSLGRCEHFSESEIYGHIDSPIRDEALISSWKERAPDGPECFKCSSYPWCFFLKKCTFTRECTAIERENIETQLRNNLLKEYAIYTKQQAEPNDNDTTFENC